MSRAPASSAVKLLSHFTSPKESLEEGLMTVDDLVFISGGLRLASPGEDGSVLRQQKIQADADDEDGTEKVAFHFQSKYL